MHHHPYLSTNSPLLLNPTHHHSTKLLLSNVLPMIHLCYHPPRLFTMTLRLIRYAHIRPRIFMRGSVRPSVSTGDNHHFGPGRLWLCTETLWDASICPLGLVLLSNGKDLPPPKTLSKTPEPPCCTPSAANSATKTTVTSSTSFCPDTPSRSISYQQPAFLFKSRT